MASKGTTATKEQMTYWTIAGAIRWCLLVRHIASDSLDVATRFSQYACGIIEPPETRAGAAATAGVLCAGLLAFKQVDFL